MSRFQCCECGGYDGEVESFGKDSYGNYIDYVCEDCGAITRVSEEE